jgi:hypothetical protein
LLNHFARKNAPGILASLIDILSHSEPQLREIEGTAEDVMATTIITVLPEMPLSEVIQTLVEHKIKRVVVADENERLLGIVDRDTVLKGLAEE